MKNEKVALLLLCLLLAVSLAACGSSSTGLPVRMAAEPLATVAQGLLICVENWPQWRSAMQAADEDV